MGRTMVIRCWCGVMVVYASIALSERRPFSSVWCANHRLHVDCSSFDTSSSFFFSFDFWLSPSSLEELMSAKFFSSIFFIFLFWYFDFFCRRRRRRIYSLSIWISYFCFFIFFIIIFPRCGEKGVVAQRRLPTHLLVRFYAAAAGDHFMYDYENRFKLN